MTITVEVDTEDDIPLQVEFEADVEMENDSYGDEFGYVKREPKPVLQSEITWDKTVYDPTSNATIFGWLKENHDKVEKMFINDYMAD